MAILKIKLFLLLVLTSYFCPGQALEYTGPNGLDIILTGNYGKLHLRTNQLMAAYDSSLGFFKLKLSPGNFEVIVEKGHDRKLQKAFKRNLGLEPLTITVHVENRPIALGNFEGDGERVRAVVEFGELSFQNVARLWGRMVGNDDMILKLFIQNNFLPPANISRQKWGDVNQIELFSEHIVILDFPDRMD